MAVTIKNLLDLEVMRDFKIIAGERGLGRRITTTEILDFEFIKEGEAYREKSFTGSSLVLSSLLFAKDNPELILSSIKKLVSQNVQALAYKPVFFEELPEEALAYAEAQNFPVLKFGRDEFFEDIIFSIRGLVEKDDSILQTEPLLGQMIRGTFTKEEAAEAWEEINPLLRPAAVCICLRPAGAKEQQIVDILRQGRPDEKLRSKTFAGKYRDRIFVVLSRDEADSAHFRAQFDDVLLAYGLTGKEMTAGISALGNIHDGFDKAVRQAYWCEKIAEIEKIPVKKYEDLGIYKLIISNLHHGTMQEYMEEYLAPLFSEEEKDGELFRTAAAYISAGGDIIKTAEQLFCHKNTIRYRIGKLQEKLDPDSSEKDFYQNLAAAVKIYLLTNQD